MDSKPYEKSYNQKDSKSLADSRAVDSFSDKPKGIPFTTNFYKFKMGGSESGPIYKFKVKFTPEIEVRHQKEKMRIFGRVKKDIKSTYGVVVYEGNEVMYSTKNIQDEHCYNVDVKGQQYNISIKFVQLIGKYDKDLECFYGVFMSFVFRKLYLKQIGRKYFDPSRVIELKESKLKIIPGFSTAIGIHEDCPLINIDSSHRVLRDETALDVINNLRNERDRQNKIKTALEQ